MARMFVLLAPVVWLALAPAARASDMVQVCDDIAPWAPYTYPLPPATEGQPRKRAGAMVEFLDLLMKKIGQEYKIVFRPWKRCLEELKTSTGPGQSELIINASFSVERSKTYHITDEIFTLKPGVFYLKTSFPDGFKIKKREKLKDHRICGVRRYNYEEYDLKEKDISTITYSLENAFKMLGHGRCDLIASSVEPVLGRGLLGKSIVPANVSYDYVPDAPAPTFHMLIARGSPRGESLLKRLNFAIGILKGDGTWDRIIAEYRARMRAR